MTVRVSYRGVPYDLDMNACRRGLVNCQVAGEFDSMEGLADKCEISRSTASRFFSGRPTSLAVTLKILDALHLRFDNVAGQASDDNSTSQTDDTAGTGTAPRPKPDSGPDGAVRRSEPPLTR